MILHGLMGSSDNWRTIARALAPRFRAICMDLPNHGRSPAMEHFDLSSIGAAIVASMDALGIERAVVLGHSLGGKVAMQMASDHPGRLRGLVVVDISPRAIQPVHLFILRACEQMELGAATRRDELDKELAQFIPMAETRDFLLKNVGRDAAGRFVWKVPLRHLIANYRVVSEAPPLKTPNDLPALFVAGGKSPFRLMQDQALVREWFPAARFVLVPEAGHLVHLNQPELFLKALNGFLTTLP